VNAFWTYFWPVFALGVVVGGLGGWIAFRRRLKSLFAIALGIALAGALIWHGPLGAAGRLSATIERDVRDTLVYYEMTRVQAHLQHGPLARRVQLSGPANDFQRSELVRLIEEIPGVNRATWSGGRGIPLIAEAAGVSVLGFLVGLLLAYLVELRRRYNAQWKW